MIIDIILVVGFICDFEEREFTLLKILNYTTALNIIILKHFPLIPCLNDCRERLFISSFHCFKYMVRRSANYVSHS